ncbi:hypothetical protein [Aquiflexum lacus]|nr:hypothetical protein [Aquiflexum lacus]
MKKIEPRNKSQETRGEVKESVSLSLRRQEKSVSLLWFTDLELNRHRD